MIPGLSGRRSTTSAVLVAVAGAVDVATIDAPCTLAPAAPVAVPPMTMGGLALALPTAVGPKTAPIAAEPAAMVTGNEVWLLAITTGDEFAIVAWPFAFELVTKALTPMQLPVGAVP